MFLKVCVCTCVCVVIMAFAPNHLQLSCFQGDVSDSLKPWDRSSFFKGKREAAERWSMWERRREKIWKLFHHAELSEYFIMWSKIAIHSTVSLVSVVLQTGNYHQMCSNMNLAVVYMWTPTFTFLSSKQTYFLYIVGQLVCVCFFFFIVKMQKMFC